MAVEAFGQISWKRMIRAAERVRERLLRVSEALQTGGIDYAVIDDNAIAALVSKVDESAVRNTQDVDLLVRRADLNKIKDILEKTGFVYRHVAGMDLFLDGPQAKARDAVHIIFAGEKVRPEYLEPAPDVDQSEPADSFRVITLPALVRMKLTSFRDKDRTHLRDLLEIGLIDQSWCSHLPKELADRLQLLINHPDG